MISAVSFQFWYALKRPPIHHPLFRRVSRRPPLPPRQLSLAQQIALMAVCVGAAILCLRYYSEMIFVAIFFIPLAAAALYITLNGTIAGLYWAIRVSGEIARERERGTYELLSASPYGAFSASWAICTGCQYYDQMFNGAGVQRVWFSRIFFLTLILLSVMASLGDPRIPGHQFDGLIHAITLVAALAFALYIDDIHSAVVGSLVGLIVPIFVRQPLNARVAAFGGFLALQLCAYGLVWLIGFELLPRLNSTLALSGFASVVALPFEQLVVFFAVREAITRVLWRVNSRLLDGDVSDLRVLTKGGRLIC